MIKFIATMIIRKRAKEYLNEFKAAKIAEIDEGYYTFVGDKHYFEFERKQLSLKLVKISDIIYW